MSKRLLLSILLMTGWLTRVNAQTGWQLDTLQIGGIKQVIASKGLEYGPLLLFLHGGPGGTRMKELEAFTGRLQKYFRIVHWDQRESGRTASLNKTPGKISLNLMFIDTKAIIDTLLKRYKQPKLYLAAESWGTTLGFRMVELVPEKLHAYLAFSPVIDQTTSERLLLNKLLSHADSKGLSEAKKELQQVQLPFKSSKDLYHLRKWWFRYDGKGFADKDSTMLRKHIDTWSTTWLEVWNEALAINLFERLPKAECPVYLFAGGKDYQTSSMVTKSYSEKLLAPAKRLYWYEKASHDVLISHADKIQEIIIKEVLQN